MTKQKKSKESKKQKKNKKKEDNVGNSYSRVNRGLLCDDKGNFVTFSFKGLVKEFH